MSIVVTDLHYTYNVGLPTESVALKGVSLEVKRGEIVSIVGLMGSGKSTLAQHLNGLLFSQKGSVYVDGCKVAEETVFTDKIRKKVGYVFQYPEQQIFSETVESELSFGPLNWGVGEEEIAERIKKSISLIGLDEKILPRNPFTLSGGAKRRLAIASVIASAPDYLILDEPNAGLDASGSEELVNLMRVQASNDVGVVHITHDLNLALNISDKILVLHEGVDFSWGTPLETAEAFCSSKIGKMPLPDMLNLSKMLKSRGVIDKIAFNPHSLVSMLVEE